MIIEATIPINPGDLAANKAKRSGRTKAGVPYSYTPKSFKEARAKAAACIREARGDVAFLEGPVRVSLVLAWPRVRRSGPAIGLPMGDLDGPQKALFDACTDAGAWADDSQQNKLSVDHIVAKENPRIEIRLERGTIQEAP